MSAFGDADTDKTTTPEERARAAEVRSGKGAEGGTGGGLSIVRERVRSSIDEDARQKYVLIQVRCGEEEALYIVRGRRLASYHVNCAEPALDELRECGVKGIEYQVLGGGRIEHNSMTRKIEVYGHSYGFPWQGEFQHDISAAVLRLLYPGFTVTTSNSGY